MKALKHAGLAAALVFAAGLAQAQVPQYGPNVTLEQARKAVAAAEAESKKNGWPMAIAVVDTAGMLVHFVEDGRHADGQRRGGAGQGRLGRDLSPPDQGLPGRAREGRRRAGAS